MIDLEDARNVQCNRDGCDEPFEIDGPEPGYPEPDVHVPVECDKGKFCSEACRARAMYEAQDEDGKLAMRRYYLGAQLASDNRLAVQRIMQDWEIDPVICGDTADDDLALLSPDGGTRGVPGPEDDCEAYLLDQATRKILSEAIYQGRYLAQGEVIRAEQNAAQFKTDYWESQVAPAKERLAKAEAAMRTLSFLKKVTD